MENVKHLALPTQQQGLAIQNFDDLLRISEFLAKSELIPANLRKKPADVAIILMKGNELGLQAMQALDSIDVIQGKPALKPEAQLALIYQRVPHAMIQIDVDDRTNTVNVAMSRDSSGKQAFKTTWTMARAAKMGLDKKDNYLKQPLVMLKWRAVGEAARTVFPDVTRGLHNSFEAEDFVEPEDDKGKRLAAALADDKPIEREVKAEVAPFEAQRPSSVVDAANERDQKQAKAAAALAEVQARFNERAAQVESQVSEPTFADFEAPPKEIDDGDIKCPLQAHNGVALRNIPKVVLPKMIKWIEEEHPKPVPTDFLDFAAAARRFLS